MIKFRFRRAARWVRAGLSLSLWSDWADEIGVGFDETAGKLLDQEAFGSWNSDQFWGQQILQLESFYFGEYKWDWVANELKNLIRNESDFSSSWYLRLILRSIVVCSVEDHKAFVWSNDDSHLEDRDLDRENSLSRLKTRSDWTLSSRIKPFSHLIKPVDSTNSLVILLQSQISSEIVSRQLCWKQW